MFLEPRKIGERLEGFAQAHVIRQNAAQPHALKMAQKIKALLLVWTQLGLNIIRNAHGRDALECINARSQFLRLLGVAEHRQRILAQVRSLLHGDLLRARIEAV